MFQRLFPGLFARPTGRTVNPRSWNASFVALGFAFVAAGASATGAWSLIDNIVFQVVLAALSILAVLFERSALIWTRVRRARKDKWAANGGIALLFVAAVYTASMQVCFFGKTMLTPVAADVKAEANAEDIAKRIGELEAKRSWMPRPEGTAKSLRERVASLEKDANNKAAVFRKAALAAAEDLGPTRTKLSNAEAYEALEAELADLREKKTKSAGAAMGDIKSAIWNAVTGGKGHGITYALIGLAVLFIQLGQILLPSLAGSAELAALRATEGDAKEPSPAPAKTVPATAARPASSKGAAAPAAPPAPAPAVTSGLAAAAAALVEQRKLDEQKKRRDRDRRARESKAPDAAPKKLGLASKVS